MRTKLKSLLLFCVLIIALTFLPSLVHAQVGDPGCDPLCNCRADGTICPIDDGVIALIVLGVAYGIKKVWDARKKAIPGSAF